MHSTADSLLCKGIVTIGTCNMNNRPVLTPIRLRLDQDSERGDRRRIGVT
jgi:hypothetical protein